MSRLQWSVTETLGQSGWRLPSINEARNYAINDFVLNKKFNYNFIQVRERTYTDKPMYVGLHNFLVEVSGAYTDMNLLCKGELENEPPQKEILLKLYSTCHARGHSSRAIAYGSTVQDCITTWIDGKCLFKLGSFCRVLGRDTAMQVMQKFEVFFLNRLGVVLSNDFHGTKDEALEKLEDAQIVQKLGWDVYEASIAKKYGMTFEQAEDVIKWGINQSDYAQMLVHSAGIHEDVRKVVAESTPENLARNLQLFFTVIKEEVLFQRQSERCNSLL